MVIQNPYSYLDNNRAGAAARGTTAAKDREHAGRHHPCKTAFACVPRYCSAFAPLVPCSIRVQIDPSSSYTISAATSVGSVTSDLPVSSQSSSRTSLRGDLNGGGPELTAKTSAGSITIESR